MFILYHEFNKEINPIKFENLLKSLPQKMVKSINCFKRWQDRHSSLIGKLMVIEGFKILGYPKNPLLSMQYNEFGKPFVLGNIHFNISHSANLVVSVFSNESTGIDAEYLNENIQINDFHSVLSTKEFDELSNSTEKINMFYDIWCKKESVIKADGRGFYAPISHLVLRQNTASLEKKIYYLNRIDVSSKYKVYVATETKNSKSAINVIKFKV